jgi:hypothetical protein
VDRGRRGDEASLPEIAFLATGLAFSCFPKRWSFTTTNSTSVEWAWNGLFPLDDFALFLMTVGRRSKGSQRWQSNTDHVTIGVARQSRDYYPNVSVAPEITPNKAQGQLDSTKTVT